MIGLSCNRRSIGWMLCGLLACASPAAAEVGQPAGLLLQVNEARAACDWRLLVALTSKGPGLDRVWKLLVRWAAWEGTSASLTTVLEPAGFQGTSRLVLEDHAGSPDRAWVVLSLESGDVLPVGEHLRGEGLLTADFTYDDEQRWIAPQDYDLSRLPAGSDDPPGSVLLQGIPRGERWVQLGYSRVLWWIDPRRREIVRARFFGADGELLKELEVLDWVEAKAPTACWLPRRQRMRNLKTGSVSELELERFEGWPDPSPKELTPERLPTVAAEMIRRELREDSDRNPPLRSSPGTRDPARAPASRRRRISSLIPEGSSMV